MVQVRKAIIGEPQTINIDFGRPKSGEVYEVEVLIKRPSGEITADSFVYKFYKQPKQRGNK